MRIRKITIGDACEVTEYTRDQLRGMIRDLPPFLTHQSDGNRRQFSRTDLQILCVITQLEQRHGIKRAAIGLILDQLRETLNLPRAMNRNAMLRIVFAPPTVIFMTQNALVPEGLVIPLGPIFERVEHYLGVHSEGFQTELPLGPVAIRQHA